MDMNQVHSYARKLVETHGAKAEARAAAELKAAESAGDQDRIENWRRIRSAVRERKMAHVS
jgi:hypothetical protein